jgi:hypothetical protein
MAAEILPGELSLDLYQIDLSGVSKYIGETEKHLSAIFREAEQSQAGTPSTQSHGRDAARRAECATSRPVSA